MFHYGLLDGVMGCCQSTCEYFTSYVWISVTGRIGRLSIVSSLRDSEREDLRLEQLTDSRPSSAPWRSSLM